MRNQLRCVKCFLFLYFLTLLFTGFLPVCVSKFPHLPSFIFSSLSFFFPHLSFSFCPLHPITLSSQLPRSASLNISMDFPKRWDGTTWGYSGRQITDGESVCVLCLGVCANLYALLSVVRPRVLEKWIIYSIWWLIISLCLQQLTDHWERKAVFVSANVCVWCQHKCSVIRKFCVRIFYSFQS